MPFKVLFSNIGYARGIDGSLWQHISRLHRHFYCSTSLQEAVLSQLKGIIHANQPDVACFVEIDEGSAHSAYFNQVKYLLEGGYDFFDAAGKYGTDSWKARLPFRIGKCSAFISKHDLDFKRLYFKNGSKRLIHQVELPGNVSLYFSHFSLWHTTRAKQFAEMKEIVRTETGPVIIMADFNILKGFGELAPLLDGTDLKVLNNENEHTFKLHRINHTLDLCIASASIADKLSLRIIPQPFSDHAALLVEGDW